MTKRFDRTEPCRLSGRINSKKDSDAAGKNRCHHDGSHADGRRHIGYGTDPHGSENGIFGDEEEKEIIPAITQARNEGIQVEGPEPPDTVFVKCQAGQYDIVVAMYHDQGHIPVKLTGFRLDSETNTYSSMSGINCTIGLPIIRTSVDHGTAYGKAGEGRANEESMIEAIFAATIMAENMKKMKA